ncbi:MAG: hypothetical protein ACYC2S_14170 [Spirochaetales bacterium]
MEQLRIAPENLARDRLADGARAADDKETRGFDQTRQVVRKRPILPVLTGDQ